MIEILDPVETNIQLALAELRSAEIRLMTAKFAMELRRKIPAHDTVGMSGRAGVSGGGGANV